jgi:ABC-type Fe3+-hydroxamate transport system substrate-binding protein
MSDIRSLGDALEMIERLGELTNREAAAGVIAATLRDDFSRLSYETSALPSRSVLYLIWRNPWMAAGHDTFIDAMLRQAGWLNVAGHLDRYPAQPLKAWSELQPELVFLSSEPYPFRDRHLAEVRSAFPGARAMLVDGEMFSWYGSRLLSAPDYFRSLTKAIHDSD